MKRVKPQKINNLLSEYIRVKGLTGALESGKIYSAWNKVLGEEIGSMTKRRYFSKGVLYCTMDSSSARSFLNSKRGEIVASLNKFLGKQIVKELVIK